MIKIIESKNDIIASEDNPFGCRILSIANAYKIGEPFTQFWAQDGGASLAKLDDAVVLEVQKADWEELADFLRMLDVKTVLCAEDAAENLKLPVALRGEIMLLRDADGGLVPPEVVQNPGVREIYALLCEAQSETFVPPEFEAFYLDMSYRVRHGAAMSVGIRIDGKLAACALCPSMTEHTAIVSAVAVQPEHRREGLGHVVVQSLLTLLNRERVYIFRADGENEEFYRAMGFLPDGRWAQIHF